MIKQGTAFLGATQQYYMGYTSVQWQLLSKLEMETKGICKCLQNVNVEVLLCQLPGFMNMFPLGKLKSGSCVERQQWSIACLFPTSTPLKNM